jgi:lysozyme family protein
LISKQERLEIFWHQYWVASRAAYIQHRYLAIVLMDTAVNFGVKRAHELLFTASGQEGWGDGISARVHREVSAARIADRIVALRMEHRGRRVVDEPSQAVFLKGWLNRDHALLRVDKF